MLTVADTLALYEGGIGSAGTRVTIDVLWPASLIVLAIAAWQSVPQAARTGRGERASAVVIPASAIVGAVLVLAYGDVARVSVAAGGVAVVALVIAVVRMCLIVRDNARMLALVQRQAKTDPLTGIDNRRSLLETIDREVRTATEDAPLLLVYYDLNGFKDYNDAFGHLAGDALLTRLGAKLSEAVGAYGHAYRVGGDEFCALLHCPPESEAATLEATIEALAERGQGFDVTTAHGVVRVPAEARDSFQALHLADQRLYELKEVRPGSAKHQLRDVLLQAFRERQGALDEHQRDVAELAREVGRRLGLPPDQLDLIAAAAELHDVGKIAISDAILDKPGPLDADEWQRMRHHTVLGERILAAAGRRARPLQPRALRRLRLPRRAGRRGDPHRRAGDRGLRRLRRDDDRPRLPRRPRGGRGDPPPAAPRGVAVRPARGRRVHRRGRTAAAAAPARRAAGRGALSAYAASSKCSTSSAPVSSKTRWTEWLPGRSTSSEPCARALASAWMIVRSPEESMKARRRRSTITRAGVCA
jgi:diguanylate cyclase (GGDEF)-like protein